MMRKKIVSLCMALVLCLGLLPATALAVGGAPSSLYVGNQQVISSSDITYWTTDESTGGLTKYEGNNDNWNVKYDQSTATLTLKNANISGSFHQYDNLYTAGIYAKGSSNQSVSLTIKLIGENTITGFYGIFLDAEASATSYGTDASLTITSENNGSLQVSGLNYGIYVKSGTGNASLTINDASVVAKTTQTYSSFAGVYVQSSAHATSSPQLSLAVNGGSLTTSASKGNDGIQFYVGSSEATGATTRLTVSENAIVRAENGINAYRVDKPTPSGTGIVFNDKKGTVYDDVTLDESLTIAQGETLTIPEGSTLTVPEGKILTNNGTIDNSGTLTNNGTVTNNGTLNVNEGGKLEGEPTSGTGTVVSAPKITTESLASGTVGAAYSQALQADNAPTLWSITSGSLPDGLNLSGSTISGTPTTAGTSTFTVKAENSAGSDSKEYTLTIQSATVPVTGVKLNTETLELYTGDTATLTATVQPSNATNKDVTWESSDTSVATVDTSGLVTAVGAGTATITVTTADQSKTATCEVTVTAASVPVTGVTLSQNQASLYYNRTPNTLTLTATVAPDNATNKAVTWTSSNPSVATVKNGVVTAVAPGTAVITATAADGSGASASCTVTVSSYLPPANPNYRITVEATQGGTVTADPTAAKAGATVTLTPVPHRGYQVGSVAVTDRFGEPVAVTEQANGTYTFTMPNGQVTVTVTFEQAPLPFHDVTEGDWFYDAVRYAYETGLMDGVGGNRFAPNSETTRAQLVTILYRLAGEPEPGGDSGFSDVAAGTWYTDAVAWAAQNGIVNGVSDTEFAPGDDITREQLAAILYRYAACQGYDVSQRADLSGFGDASSISGYAQEALSWAHAQGLVLGFEDGSLRPQGTASRAQIAAVLMRFLAAVPTE